MVTLVVASLRRPKTRVMMQIGSFSSQAVPLVAPFQVKCRTPLSSLAHGGAAGVCTGVAQIIWKVCLGTSGANPIEKYLFPVT
jgi:hypothetical protein